MPLEPQILQGLQPPAPPDILGPFQRMQALRTQQLQQADIASQVQERQAIAAQRQLATQQATKAAQALQEHFTKGGDPDDPILQAKLYGISQSIGDAYAKHRGELAKNTSEVTKNVAEAGKAQSDVETGKATRVNLFSEVQNRQKQRELEAAKEADRVKKENDALAKQNAQEAAGLLVPGSETFQNGEKFGLFKVRQADGTYTNERRSLGKTEAEPKAGEPPMTPERFKQQEQLERDKAAAKAIQAQGNDPRLANVPPNQHKDVLDKYQKAQDAYNGSQSARDRIDTVLNMARSGNKEAQASAALVGVQAINELANVKRVNQAEIANYGNAGSLIDRLQGKIGRITEGKPIPDDVLKDMQALHDTLAGNADKAFVRSVDSLNRTYNSHFNSSLPGKSGGSDFIKPGGALDKLIHR